jgi:hypothetical protein
MKRTDTDKENKNERRKQMPGDRTRWHDISQPGNIQPPVVA